MPWYKVVLSTDDILADRHFILRDAFANLLFKAGSPKDAAMFEGNELAFAEEFFSPRAVEIARDLIAQFGGVGCQPPTKDKVGLMAGHQSAFDLLPEPTSEEEDNY